MILVKGDEPHLEQKLFNLLFGMAIVGRLAGWLVVLLLLDSFMSATHFGQMGQLCSKPSTIQNETRAV